MTVAAHLFQGYPWGLTRLTTSNQNYSNETSTVDYANVLRLLSDFLHIRPHERVGQKARQPTLLMAHRHY